MDSGSPEGGVSRPIPIETALDDDTLLAYFMNGEPLTADHGFPIRLLVPGWIGSNSVKWVGRITVSSQEIWVNRNTQNYVFIGPDWPVEKYLPAKGAPITTQNIKSSLALGWNAELPAGKHTLRGVARSPSQIVKVEWSDNKGEVWQEARLLDPRLRHAWVRFEFEWEAASGQRSIMTRAYDGAGNVQPMRIPFNEEGYLFNAVYKHPIKVI